MDRSPHPFVRVLSHSLQHFSQVVRFVDPVPCKHFTRVAGGPVAVHHGHRPGEGAFGGAEARGAPRQGDRTQRPPRLGSSPRAGRAVGGGLQDFHLLKRSVVFPSWFSRESMSLLEISFFHPSMPVEPIYSSDTQLFELVKT